MDYTEKKNVNDRECQVPFTIEKPHNVQSASNKQVTTFKMKLNSNRRNSASEFMSGKGSFIKENSNFLSDNFSLFQDKEKIFPDDNNELPNDFNLNNFDITNPNSRNSSFIRTNLCLPNLKSIEKKKINSKNEFRLLDPVRETLREHVRLINNRDTDGNSTIAKRSSSLHIFQTPGDRKANPPLERRRRMSYSFVEGKRNKQRNSLIPIASAIKKTNIPPFKSKHTVNSSQSSLSTHTIENKENYVEYAKLKEFEHLIKPSTNKDNAKNDTQCDINIQNFYSLSNIATNRRFSVDRFKHLFTDVDNKANMKLSQDLETKSSNYQSVIHKSYYEIRKNKNDPVSESNNYKSNDSHHNIFI